MLIANRGEIAIRVARTARRLGIGTVAVYSDADADAPHVKACDVAIGIGGLTPAESYLVADKIIAAARRAGAEAIHPGYGFLSENAAFAERVAREGLIFVGPPAKAIEAMGDKARARRRMAAAGIPVVPGYDEEDQSESRLLAEAERIGFPIMIKASAGGGGRGMRRVDETAAMPAALKAAASEAQKAFGDGRLILERAVIEPRHVEIQVFADEHGHAVHLGERDCSVQRRHQKVVEEAPSPALDERLRGRMGDAATAVAREIGYVGAGTVEFLLDRAGHFYFMEMNTRLQVEHPVTEMVTGLDLVEWQLRVAHGEPLPLAQADIGLRGHAVEVRLCAEDPADDFLPRTGTVALWDPSRAVRADAGLADGLVVSPYYDSMLGKLIAHGSTRTEAIEKLVHGLKSTALLGITSNREFLIELLSHPAFIAGDKVSTAFIPEHFPTNASRAGRPDRVTWALAAWLSSAATPRAAAWGQEWRGWSNVKPLPQPWRIAWLAPANLTVEDDPAERRGHVEAGRDGATVTVDGATVTIAGRPAAEKAEGEVVVDGEPVSYRFAWVGDELWLKLGSRDFAFAPKNRISSARAADAGADGVLRAPMNGRVVSVAVEAGTAVERGQTVLALEAMKMEHAIIAPRAGMLASVSVAVGDQVTPGQILAEIVD
ncbi:acetyl-/propionyl-CoA carboxylase subunit alpha [Chelatococcus reniformis]|uniref:Acetyl-/propionyl-CoA carboxylase subunit alpha n=1 Tax=Chelatococcus reniformis TaxID=1494448 RepID=A0A916UC00_9HYPH|nr:acetyl-/propionyl-CoA carboxylase subunit alpha [Chelatococcus reniformis]